MKTYRLRQFSGAAGLALCEEPQPSPERNEVIVRVRASSLNFRDLLIANGKFGPAVRPGVVPVSDGAGDIVEVGSAVRRVAVDDRVCSTFIDGWISGERVDLGFGRGGDSDGMLSEYVRIHEDSVVRLPDHLSYEEGATLPCAAVTAWNALCVYGRLIPGQIVLVQGSGAVSVFALQFARLFGARVLATTSSDVKAARLRKLGAEAVVNYRTHPDWDQEIMRLTGGVGVDVVVEVGGAATMAKSILCVRRGGRISVTGLLTGIADQGFAPAFFGRFVQFHHIHVGSRDSFEEMNRAMSFHDVHPIITARFGFLQAGEAYASLSAPGHFGKVIIRHD